jgi:arylsulfatase A-like enzyme
MASRTAVEGRSSPMGTLSNAGRWLYGAGLAALWGALSEATFLLLRRADAVEIWTRLARLERVGEVAAATAAAGLGAAVLAMLRPRSARRAPAPAVIASAGGLMAAAWLGLGFAAWPPPPQSIQFTGGPLALRAPLLLGTALALAVVGFAALRLARRPTHALLGGAPFVRVTLVGVAVAAACLPASPPPASPGSPDVFLLSVDTLRADHLGCYGYRIATSPAIDRLCDNAVVFTRAMSAVPETIPSYTTLYTGRLPQQTRVFNNFARAKDSLHTVAEQLRDSGYLTVAILEASFPGTFANLDQGFQLIVQRGIVAATPCYSPADAVESLVDGAHSLLDARLRRDTSVTTDVALRWLRRIAGTRPLFAHIYWPYPHRPYVPPRRYLEILGRPDAPPELADRIHAYDGEIRYTDTQIGRTLDGIARRRGDDAWVAMVADHGEELGRLGPDVDHPYFGHSLYLYDSSLHVPLIVRPPASAHVSPARIDEVVSIPSLAATLLEAAGVTPEAGMQPPLPLLGQRGKGRAFSVMRKDQDPGYDHPIDRVSVRADGWRLVETRVPRYYVELLRYGADGRATPEDDPPDSPRESLLTALHAAFPLDKDAIPHRLLSSQEKALLRSLGYLR